MVSRIYPNFRRSMSSSKFFEPLVLTRVDVAQLASNEGIFSELCIGCETRVISSSRESNVVYPFESVCLQGVGHGSIFPLYA